MQRGHQSINLGLGVVEGQGRSRGSGYAESLHHGLSTVVPRSQRQPLLIEDRSHVVGVDPFEHK